MGIGEILLNGYGRYFDGIGVEMERIAPYVPGDTFPYFFTMEIFQRALVSSILVTVIAGLLGSYLLIRNLALIGDGLAHVSFGAIAIGLVAPLAIGPYWYALFFSIFAALCIYELQWREILRGDASIAIFLTGSLALGLVSLRIWGAGITSDIHSYLFGNILLIEWSEFDVIIWIFILVLVTLFFIHPILLASTIDPLAARVQGLPVRYVGWLFSALTAAVVVSMVQVVGTLLVTALLVTPAATAQFIGKSFRSCMIWTQFFGLSSVLLGVYLSAEYDTGSGSMIALVATCIFAFVAVLHTVSLAKYSKLSILSGFPIRK